MTSAPLRLAITALLLMMYSSLAGVNASPVKSDEDVVVFPVAAAKQPDGTWRAPAHVWVFEPTGWSTSIGLPGTLVDSVAKRLGVDASSGTTAVFAERAKWFAVDNERRKQVTLELGTGNWALDRTGSNGHSTTDIVINEPVAEGATGTLKVRLRDTDTRKFQGEVVFVPPEGLSVISDIDDTIKVSNVLDKRKLLENTFLELHAITPGMPELYQQFAGQGAYFHYVSASPWQLWPSLETFISAHYPTGSIAMRHFRLKDSSLIDFLLKPSFDFKVAAIRTIIKRYPQHRFILIGDSGECDPEIYGEIYRKHPGKIEQIMIRKVSGSDFGDNRMARAFNQVPGETWALLEGAATAGNGVCKHG